ncbi:hypothetical protein DPMN_103912 [Dreissena polymorpha]|uniref:Uncharacterized protein n=1 Tax=Dreissena polymorpha TaxID=45954 RepID=A0A9D4HC03_DREPO|nr:hypothetical protein DPMN_103912 [Dreissena polymorpha]
MYYLANILHPVYGGKPIDASQCNAAQDTVLVRCPEALPDLLRFMENSVNIPKCFAHQPAEVLPEVPMETSDIEEESELTVDSHRNEVLLEVPEISESQDSSYMSELSGDTRRDKRPRLDDVIPEERPVIFEVISGGSKQGVNKLISSDGYTFTAKIHEDRKINVASRVLTRKNAPPPGSHIVQPTGILFFYLIQDIIRMNLLTKFHEDRTVNVASRVLTRFYYSHIRKNAPPLGSHFFQANIIIFDLIQDIIETNLLTEFHEDLTIKLMWPLEKNAPPLFYDDRNINVTSRVLTRKIAPPPWWPYIIGMNLLTEKNAPPLGGHVFQANVTIFELIQDIIKTNLLTIFHQDWTINRASRVFTRKNAPPPGGHVFQPTGIIFKFVQDIIGLNLLTKFHEDWTINVASRVLTRFYYSHIRKNAPPLGSHVFQAKVTIFELIQDISGTNLLREFHEDRKINVASRVLTRFYYSHITNCHHFRTHQTINVASRELTRQMLTPHNGRWTKSDHKSSP